MAENGLPCLGLLATTPGILRGLMTELTGEDARWKPRPERFSVAEVLAHLAYSESHCYRMRLDRFMAETRPDSSPTTRKCTSSCTAAPIRRRPSTDSKINARATSDFSAIVQVG